VLGNKIKILLDGLNEIIKKPPVEFTIEANPESLSQEFLSICREKGVTRLSLGIQTFNEKSRIALNRLGSVTEEKLSLASRYFPDTLSFDLMTGLPYQTEEIILNDIKTVLKYKPSHISLYSLTLEDNTPLKEKIKNKSVMLPAGDQADCLWLTGKETLLNNGFDHYEISNFARRGAECLHNIRYWRMQNWIAAGAGASSTIFDESAPKAKRYTYINDADIYIKTILEDKESFPSSKCVILEEVDRKTLLKECIIMGYRYKEGPDYLLFKKRFGCTVQQCIGKTLLKWKDKNKMLFLNSFLCDALYEIDEV